MRFLSSESGPPVDATVCLTCKITGEGAVKGGQPRGVCFREGNRGEAAGHVLGATTWGREVRHRLSDLSAARSGPNGCGTHLAESLEHLVRLEGRRGAGNWILLDGEAAAFASVKFKCRSPRWMRLQLPSKGNCLPGRISPGAHPQSENGQVPQLCSRRKGAALPHLVAHRVKMFAPPFRSPTSARSALTRVPSPPPQCRQRRPRCAPSPLRRMSSSSRCRRPRPSPR